MAGPILYRGKALGVFHLADSLDQYSHSECDLLTRVLQLTGPALYARMQIAELTRRESQVMNLILTGMSQKQIAVLLNVSVQTIAKHRTSVLEKLAVRGDVDLVYFALKRRSGRLFDPMATSNHEPITRQSPDDIAG